MANVLLTVPEDVALHRLCCVLIGCIFYYLTCSPLLINPCSSLKLWLAIWWTYGRQLLSLKSTPVLNGNPTDKRNIGSDSSRVKGKYCFFHPFNIGYDYLPIIFASISLGLRLLPQRKSSHFQSYYHVINYKKHYLTSDHELKVAKKRISLWIAVKVKNRFRGK